MRIRFGRYCIQFNRVGQFNEVDRIPKWTISVSITPATLETPDLFPNIEEKIHQFRALIDPNSESWIQRMYFMHLRCEFELCGVLLPDTLVVGNGSGERRIGALLTTVFPDDVVQVRDFRMTRNR